MYIAIYKNAIGVKNPINISPVVNPNMFKQPPLNVLNNIVRNNDSY